MSSTNVTEKFVEITGGKIGYRVEGGNGPAMLCVPGIADTYREYERFVPVMLEAGFRVITTDLRGNGMSQGKFKSYEIEDLAVDILAILDAEKIDKVCLVACSISGATAGLFAIQHPERVRNLVLFNPVFYTTPNFMSKILPVILAMPGLGKVIWMSYFKSLYPKNPVEQDYLDNMKLMLNQPGAMRSLVQMTKVKHLEERTSQIKVPTLIFFGGKDPDFKDVNAEVAKVQHDIPQAQIKVLEGVGHYPQREVPELVIPAVKDWLGSLVK